MSTHREYALIAILATIAVVGVVPAFAQYQVLPSSGGPNQGPTETIPIPVTVSTDKPIYDHNSIIMVTGHVRNPYPGQQVTIRVSDPAGNIVQISQLMLDNNGDFGTKINTASPLWTKGGVYTIFAQYGNEQGTSSKVQFTIQADNDGQITLNIPRSVLDSKNGINDQSFIVLIDGEQKDTFTETTTSDTRTVIIPFGAGVGKIEIIGTQIVPEFGPIAALVLAIAIISIIAVSAKTGLRFMPKY